MKKIRGGRLSVTVSLNVALVCMFRLGSGPEISNNLRFGPRRGGGGSGGGGGAAAVIDAVAMDAAAMDAAAAAERLVAAILAATAADCLHLRWRNRISKI